jgi:hypothetical protein
LRKSRIILLSTVVAVFGIVAVALASTNIYTVQGATSPTKAGSKAKPVPVQVTANYQVKSDDGTRPSAVQSYAFDFDGIQVNQTVVKDTCSADKINATGSPAGIDNKGDSDSTNDMPSSCPKATIVGEGFADNTVGATANPNDQSLHCYLYVKIFNSKPGHATLFLYGYTPPDGSQSKQGDKYCATKQGVAIDMVYKKTKTGTQLSFTIPKTVLHIGGILTTSVRNVHSVIHKLTRKLHGKKRGYYESIGGCKNGKRKISVIFTPENPDGSAGTPQKVTASVPCTK